MKGFVACSDKQNDGAERVGRVEQIKDSTAVYPTQVSADAGYCSEANIVAMEERKADPYLAIGRQKHGPASPIDEGDNQTGPRTQAMREKHKTGGGRDPLPPAPTGR